MLQTGSGKTTQVPQLIADELLSQLASSSSPSSSSTATLATSTTGVPLEIIVTQPRKVAAISMAYRVAFERCEKVGVSVGYQVRLESKLAQINGIRITYCTTGVLLRRMMRDPLLIGVNTVIVDEVHERDLDSDLLVTLLKRQCDTSHTKTVGLLRSCHTSKIVLMSATFNIELFYNYFSTNKSNDGTSSGGVGSGDSSDSEGGTSSRGSVAVYQVEGRLFPVHEMYLEEVVTNAGVDLRQIQTSKLCTSDRQEMDKLAQLVMSSSASTGVSLSEGLIEELKRTCCLDQDVPPQLIAQVILWLCCTAPVNIPVTEANTDGAGGACVDGEGDGDKESMSILGTILVFLPGVGEMNAVQESLEYFLSYAEVPPLNIMQLHGSMPNQEQQKVFEAPSAQVRKVILATNIAESSITISDAVYVINSGECFIV